MPFFFFHAEDGIRDFCLSRGLGDVYKRQGHDGGASRRQDDVAVPSEDRRVDLRSDAEDWVVERHADADRQEIEMTCSRTLAEIRGQHPAIHDSFDRAGERREAVSYTH